MAELRLGGPAGEVFEGHRRLLFGIAYGVLGSAADADDVLQDAWLRWSGSPRDDVRDPKAFLARVVTRLALNRRRDLDARRETYVGPWLPEPIATGPAAPDSAELADSVSLALLVLLETLTPTQRVVFVLHEVFGFPHREVADYLGRSEPAVRQLAKRARDDLRARRVRFDVDRSTQLAVTESFLAACSGGDLGALIRLLSPQVTLTADGGGEATSALRPVVGADKVARLLLGLATVPLDYTTERVEANGAPALLGRHDGVPFVLVQLVSVGGVVDEVLMIRNPAKLRRFR